MSEVIRDSIDAKVWAVEFMNLFSDKRDEIDEGLMIAWFANAIMNGFDEAARRASMKWTNENPIINHGKQHGKQFALEMSICNWAFGAKVGQSIAIARSDKTVIIQVGKIIDHLHDDEVTP